MEKPTRRASAFAIFLDFSAVDALRRIMKNSAAPKLPRMATKAMITRYVMGRIIW